MTRPVTRREHGRIWFGEGRERWSVTDPEAPENQYFLRDLACDWVYMIKTCPTAEAALEKVRLIRWALRNVERTPLPRETKEPTDANDR